MELLDFFVKQAEIVLKEIENYGYPNGSQNGPYLDNETPVRVASHWIITYIWLYKKTKEQKYFNAVSALSDFLLKQNVSSSHYSFYCRRKKGKDHVNGTIGQAWAIEALVACYSFFGNEKYCELAINVFEQHTFNYKIGLWDRKEVNGIGLGYDETFNHQLWLAAAGAEILSVKYVERIDNEVQSFLNFCKKNNIFRIHKNGVIRHYLCVSNGLKPKIKYYKNLFLEWVKNKCGKPSLKYKEEGYHYFSMYGFAILKEYYKNHELFNSIKFKKALEYTINIENAKRQINRNYKMDGTHLAEKYKNNVNIYCFSYNSPLFELPLILKRFLGNVDSKITNDLWELFKKNLLTEDNDFNENVVDKIVLRSRIYEYIRAFTDEE